MDMMTTGTNGEQQAVDEKQAEDVRVPQDDERLRRLRAVDRELRLLRIEFEDADDPELDNHMSRAVNAAGRAIQRVRG